MPRRIAVSSAASAQHVTTVGAPSGNEQIYAFPFMPDRCSALCYRLVWRVPLKMEDIYTHPAETDLFAAIGTSSQVYPEAAFVHKALAAGAHNTELTLEPSALASAFAEAELAQHPSPPSLG